jgi:ABC-type multidrug transport system fused ATPase/permease subunit
MLRRFFSYYRPYKKLFLIDFGCAVFAGVLELAFPLAVSKFTYFTCLYRIIIHLRTEYGIELCRYILGAYAGD